MGECSIDIVRVINREYTWNLLENEIYATIKFYWFSSDINDLYLPFNFANIHELARCSLWDFIAHSAHSWKRLFVESAWETREYYSLVCLDDLNMVKQTLRRWMRCVFLWGGFSERLHKSRMHRVATSGYLNIACSGLHDILMRFFHR